MERKEKVNLRKSTLSLLLSIVTLVSTIAFVGIAPAGVARPIYVSVDPPVNWDPTMLPGAEFTVDLTVTLIKRPSAYQFELYFNPDVLHAVSVENGPFLGSKGGDVEVIGSDPPFDNTVGKVNLFGGILDPPDVKNPTGSSEQLGPLATVGFQVVGVGYSALTLGLDTLMVNITGGVEFPQYSGQYIYGYWNPDCLRHGFFSNEPGPELFIRTKGAHGGGVWPEWHVDVFSQEQTLYCRVRNYGEIGAWVKVKFMVVSPAYSVMEYWSNEAWIDKRTEGSSGLTAPGVIVVSATFTPPGPGPAECTVSALLYFKAGPISEYIYYGSEGIGLNGEGASRDIATKYKVVIQHAGG